MISTMRPGSLPAFHQCAPREPVALAAGEIGAGEQCRIRRLSVSLRTVRGMWERRFRRSPGGVCALGLHLVWCRRDIEHQWDAVLVS